MRRRVLSAYKAYQTPTRGRGLDRVLWRLSLECRHTAVDTKSFKPGFEPEPPAFVFCLDCNKESK